MLPKLAGLMQQLHQRRWTNIPRLVRFPWPLVAGGLLLLLLLALGAGLYANRNLRSPAGVETRPAPKLTRPVAEMRMRWPRLTTRPLFVQPLAALSPRTCVLIWKKLAEV